MKKLVLLSGGVDSKVLLHRVVKKFGSENVYALFFAMPNNRSHLTYASQHAKQYSVEFFIYSVDIYNSNNEIPFRNAAFISLSLYFAKIKECDEIYMAIKRAGQHYLMKTWYDCSEAFVRDVNAIAEAGGLSVIAPFVSWSTRDVFEYAKEELVDISDCISCDFAIADKHCGVCGKCLETAYEAQQSGLKTAIEADVSSYFRIEEFRLYINNLCQKNCSFCSYDHLRKKPDYMDLDFFSTYVIPKILKWDIRSVMISGREPLYNIQHFEKIITSLRYLYHKKIYINTNGINLKYLSCSNNIDKIYLSLNYKHFDICELSNALKKKITLYFVPTEPIGYEYLKKIYLEGYLDQGVDSIYLRMPISVETRPFVNDKTNYLNWLTYLSKIGFTVEPPFTHDSCQRYRRNLTILTDGEVLPCAKDSYKEIYAGSNYNIEDLTLDMLMGVPARKQLCPIMAQEQQNRIKYESFFGDCRISQKQSLSA